MNIVRLIMTALSLTVTAALATPAEPGKYLEVRLLVESEDGYIEAGSVAGCYLSDAYKRCVGVFYESEEHTGVTSGSIDSGEKDAEFEIPYSLTIVEQSDGMLLYGLVYALRYSQSDIVSGGVRHRVRQAIDFGDELIIEPGFSDRGKELALGIRLLHQRPEQKMTDLTGPLALKTVLYKGSQPYSHTTHTHGGISDSNRVATGFGLTKPDGHAEQVDYRVDVLLPSLPQTLLSPFSTELVLRRTYVIDTLFYSLEDFDSDVEYRSEYRKQVHLVPGTAIMLVFPPDTPSVRGFDIEDTLLIAP